MKDQGPRYDPRVAELVGFNPNGPYEAPVADQRNHPITAEKPVPFDIGLEFARRMKDQLGESGDFFNINQHRLLAAVSMGDTVTRTYYSYIPHAPASRQQFEMVQELTLKKGKRGIFSISEALLTTTHPNRVWSKLHLSMGVDKTIFEAESEDTSRTLRVEYDENIQSPLVVLNGNPIPPDSPWPLLEGNSDFSLYESVPSSVIVPKRYHWREVASSIPLDASLSIAPMDEQVISDMGLHNSRDPLKIAMIRWVP